MRGGRASTLWVLSGHDRANLRRLTYPLDSRVRVVRVRAGSVARETEKLCLLGKYVAPAAWANVTLDEFARIRRLEVDADIAALVALRRTLIFDVRLTDLLLRR